MTTRERIVDLTKRIDTIEACDFYFSGSHDREDILQALKARRARLVASLIEL